MRRLSEAIRHLFHTIKNKENKWSFAEVCHFPSEARLEEKDQKLWWSGFSIDELLQVQLRPAGGWPRQASEGPRKKWSFRTFFEGIHLQRKSENEIQEGLQDFAVYLVEVRGLIGDEEVQTLGFENVLGPATR